MQDYLIATASTSDLEASWLNEHHIPFISYSFIIDGKAYNDDCTLQTKQFVYEQMRAGKMLNTSAISEYAYYEFFKELMSQGKDVLYIDMSRAISSSIENAEIAAESIRKKFPDQKLYFLDSYCITGGLKLFIKQLVKKHEDGESFEDLIAWGEEHKKEYIHRFMVDDLHWLSRGGRLSNATAVVGTMLAIKPMLYVDNEGKLISFGQAHGRKKCFKQLIESMKDDLADYSADEEITIISADDREDCEKLIEDIKNAYPQLSNAEFTITDLGPTICAHVGPGFAAIIYHGKPRVM